jgi:ACS family hexuronate transporter-like MFS transporter
MNSDITTRPVAWRYYVCGLLLLATTINYLDRQALSATSIRITRELSLSEEQYGKLELVFGWAFAVGAAVFGWVADRTSVRWLYPAVLILWSVMGFLTGLVETYVSLLVCRMFLGFFEAGHWPCALKTTQRILTARERTLGNSILQSGSSIGAILTPLIVMAMLTKVEPGVTLPVGEWRPVFQVIGVVGIGWAVLWLMAMRPGDFSNASQGDPSTTNPSGAVTTRPFWSVLWTRRFITLLIVVVAINACWHIFRAWLPKFLVQGRGYSEQTALAFNSAFYVATDVGCIAAGLISVWLVRRGWSVHWSRVSVYAACALMTSASIAIIWLPAGWPLLGVLLLVGCGSLGLFPCYYSFSQELSVEHQGKVSGVLGAFAWATVSPLHWIFGKIIDQTGSYDTGMALSGLCPLFGVLFLAFFWDKPGHPSEHVDAT